MSKKNSAPRDPFDLNVHLDGFDVGFGAPLAESAENDGVALLGNLLPNRDAPEDGAEYTGDFEHDAARDIERIKQDFSHIDEERRKAARTIGASRDVDFVIQVVFLDMPQRDAFLKASGWERHGKRYVNGLELAKAMGIELPESAYRPPKPRIDKTWSKYALEAEVTI